MGMSKSLDRSQPGTAGQGPGSCETPFDDAALVVGQDGAVDSLALDRDRMAYMADMLLELKDMATRSGHPTLVGLLALAHAEAKQRMR